MILERIGYQLAGLETIVSFETRALLGTRNYNTRFEDLGNGRD